MSSMTGRKRADGQRVSPLIGLLAGPSTAFLDLAARHPSPAIRKLLDRNFSLVTGQFKGDATERELTITGAHGPIPARLYEPAGLPEDPGLLVAFHGGGFCLGSLDSHANVWRFTAKHARCKVLSVGYTKAPEARMPGAFDDCRAGFRWAVEHAAELGVDPERIAVGGDSAGGQLAAAVGLITDGGPKPAFCWLVYPVVDADISAYESAWLFERGPLLSRRNLSQMLYHYVPTAGEKRDGRMDLIHRGDLHELPPSYCATAGMDPLRDQGERFVALAQEAGAQVRHQRFTDLPHGFNLLLVDPTARAAYTEMCEALAHALAPVPVAA